MNRGNFAPKLFSTVALEDFVLQGMPARGGSFDWFTKPYRNVFRTSRDGLEGQVQMNYFETVGGKVTIYNWRVHGQDMVGCFSATVDMQTTKTEHYSKIEIYIF